MRSMTGYGRVQKEADGREITVEVKTVNHRFLDISFRIPRNFGFAEDMIRNKIGEVLLRGHVDVFINYRNNRLDAKTVSVDTALLMAYRKAFKKASRKTGIKDDLKLSQYIGLNDIITVKERTEDQQAVANLLGEALAVALGEVAAMRNREGEALKLDLLNHLSALERHTGQIAGQAPRVVKAYRDRLEARLGELNLEPVEPQRLAQEVALFADKCAIDEELFRLASHISQFRQLLESQDQVGRKMDFLVQELNREVNTIGSKASDADITGWVVDAKSEIEKLREQVQNIE